MIAMAGERGVPVAVFRPGFVVADSKTGACNGDDHLDLFFRSCLKMGSFPEDIPPVPVVPVNTLATAIVSLSERYDLKNRVFHLINPKLLSAVEMLAEYGKAEGKLKKIDTEAWFSLVEATIDTAEPLPIVQFLAAYKMRMLLFKVEGKGFADLYDCHYTCACLQENNITYPEATLDVTKAYFGFLAERGLV